MLERALALGFSDAAFVDPSRLTFSDAESVRAACMQNVCGCYDRCWTCPPAAGSVGACVSRVKKHSRALLARYDALLPDTGYSAEFMESSRDDFRRMTRELKALLLSQSGEVLALGVGGCGLCANCSYPHEYCRRPAELVESLSAYCVNISELFSLAGWQLEREGYLTYAALCCIDRN